MVNKPEFKPQYITHSHREFEWRMKKRFPTLLYVDDDENAIRTFCRHVRHQPWRICTATSAEEAMEIAIEKNFDIELAVLDLMMPGMDGFELLRSLRFFDPCLPIMIVTGCLENEYFFQALELGCDGFMEKPYNPNILVAMMRTLLPLRNRIILEERDILRRAYMRPEERKEKNFDC